MVRQGQPTAIELWNLQPDDVHDFELLGPDGKELVALALPPLAKKSHVFNFHKPGLYTLNGTWFPCPSRCERAKIFPGSVSNSGLAVRR